MASESLDLEVLKNEISKRTEYGKGQDEEKKKYDEESFKIAKGNDCFLAQTDFKSCYEQKEKLEKKKLLEIRIHLNNNDLNNDEAVLNMVSKIPRLNKELQILKVKKTELEEKETGLKKERDGSHEINRTFFDIRGRRSERERQELYNSKIAIIRKEIETVKYKKLDVEYAIKQLQLLQSVYNEPLPTASNSKDSSNEPLPTASNSKDSSNELKEQTPQEGKEPTGGAKKQTRRKRNSNKSRKNRRKSKRRY